MSSWPLVAVRDSGIRPAGRPDECFYCQQRVGQPHSTECVVVMKTVEMRITIVLDGATIVGLWTFDEPHHWDEHMSEFHKNNSSWCADNILDDDLKILWGNPSDLAKVEALSEAEGCLCGFAQFERVCVVDATPRVQEREDT